MRRTFLIIIVVNIICSCDFILGVKNLGDGYYFDTDQILYTEKPTYGGIGSTAIPPEVLDVKKNDEIIIVAALNNRNLRQYWIINKKAKKEEIGFVESDGNLNSYYVYSNVQGPLDSVTFIQELQKRKIDLGF